jgi:hypothetical protein
MLNLLNRAYRALKLFLISPPKPHSFVTKTLRAGGKGFITIVIGGLLVTVPSSCLSIVKNLGLAFLLGIPIISNIIDYTVSVSVPLADLQSELENILRELGRLLSQLDTFISRFNNFVLDTGINVVTDASGALGIDVLATLDDAIAQQYANRIEVMDNLIHNHIHSIEDLLARASAIEAQIMAIDNGHVSQLAGLSSRLRELISSYGH